jgi:hypothetical protein
VHHPKIQNASANAYDEAMIVLSVGTPVGYLLKPSAFAKARSSANFITAFGVLSGTSSPPSVIALNSSTQRRANLEPLRAVSYSI